MKNKIVKFHKIKFYNCLFSELINKLSKKKKSYLVAPAASSLSQIYNDKKHLIALQKSTVAIFDSGFFCLLLFLFRRIRVKKFSGYLFFNSFINCDLFKKEKLLCIDPNKDDASLNKKLLQMNKFTKLKSYIAPKYNLNNVKDVKLLQLINLYKPKYILINIGGGVQEKLALFINQYSKNNQISFCLGAAIGFFTGQQATINFYLEKYYLGWLARVLHNPYVFLPRVLKSIYLIKSFFDEKVFK